MVAVFFCHRGWKIRGSQSVLGGGGTGHGQPFSEGRRESVSVCVKAKAY